MWPVNGITWEPEEKGGPGIDGGASRDPSRQDACIGVCTYASHSSQCELLLYAGPVLSLSCSGRLYTQHGAMSGVERGKWLPPAGDTAPGPVHSRHVHLGSYSHMEALWDSAVLATPLILFR